MILEVVADCARDFPYVHEFALGSKPQDSLARPTRSFASRRVDRRLRRRDVIFAQSLLTSCDGKPRAHPARGGARHAPSAPLGGRLPARPRPRAEPRRAARSTPSPATEYLDFASFYGSNPLGYRHPKMLEPDVQARLARAATLKVGNPDFYTTYYAEFVETLARTAAPPELPHYFFVEGGALAVENGMKAAFDWKVRKNLAAGSAGGRQSDPALRTGVPRSRWLHAERHQYRSDQDPALSRSSIGRACPRPKCRSRSRNTLRT